MKVVRNFDFAGITDFQVGEWTCLLAKQEFGNTCEIEISRCLKIIRQTRLQSP